MTTRSDLWRECTRARPCVICGKTSWCSYSTDGAQRCMKSVDPPSGWTLLRADESGGRTFRRTEEVERQRTDEANEADESQRAAMLEEIRRTRAAITDALVEELATSLGLPVEAVRSMRPGWSVPRSAWVFVERDGGQRIVGVTYRSRDGEKRGMAGSSRGLSIPPGLDGMSGPVLVVEGPTDVMACAGCGIAAVGRPSNRGGTSDLAALLAARADDVYVVGEFDPKPDSTWPGRDGAVAVAQGLATRWGKPVRWTMAPDRRKDVRAWVADSIRQRPDTDLGSIGGTLMARLSELSRRATAARGLNEGDERVVIANASDLNEGKQRTTLAVPISAISDDLRAATEGWPRRIAGAIFSCDPPDPGSLPNSSSIRWLKSPADLFAWINERCGPPRWLSSTKDCYDRATRTPCSPLTKIEFHAHLEQSATPNYESVEYMPHEPPVNGAFYVPCDLPPPTGETFAELAENFNAASDLDMELLILAAITPAWGGGPGRRPAFVLVSEERGSGKTDTANFIAELWGGAVFVDENEDWEGVRKRLLCDESLAQRVLIIDNIRGRMARSGLESAVTAKRIDGWRPYYGQASRPNRLTWMLTANAPELSTDLAERAVVIKVGRPKYASGWEEWSDRFMRERRPQFIADCLARINAGPVTETVPTARWREWTNAVLRTSARAPELAEQIMTSRAEVDQDLEIAENVRDIIQRVCERLGVITDRAVVSISKKDMKRFLVDEEIVPGNWSVQGASRWLKGISGLPPLRGLTNDPSRSRGSGGRRWLWVGTDASEEETPRIFEISRNGSVTDGQRVSDSQPNRPDDQIPF